jgi:hypothetical protein
MENQPMKSNEKPTAPSEHALLNKPINSGVSRIGSEGIAGHDREGTHQVNAVRPGGAATESAGGKEALETPL